MMMRGVFAIMVLLFGLAAPMQAQASDLTLDIAQRQIDITTGFNGSFLHVYGVRENAGDVIITISGPKRHKIVRKKGNVAGIWMNVDAMKFRHVPVYYDFASSMESVEALPSALLSEYMIGLDALRFQPDVRDEPEDEVVNFQEALIRNSQRQGVYPLRAQPIEMMENGLFKAQFYIPANVPTGDYKVQAMLVRGGDVVETRSLDLTIGQVGMSANIYQFAKDSALFYGLCCVLIALSAGLGATFMRRS